MSMTDEQLIAEVEAQRSLMIAVATGGPRIQQANGQYVDRRERIAIDLRRRGIEDPNPHGDLWSWYGRWSAGDMPSWQSRREHLSAVLRPTTQLLHALLVALKEAQVAWLKP